MKEHVGCGCFPTGKHYAGIAHLLRVQIRGILAEFDADTPWQDLPIALLDVETTGTDPVRDRVVELGIVVGLRGEIVSRVNWLVQPGIPIPDSAREIHGIGDDDVKNAPTFAAIAAEVAAALRHVVPAAYNASFDRSFVAAELTRSGVRLEDLPVVIRPEVSWIDPLVWARELQKEEKSKRLGEVAARLGVALENAHRAADDAEAALRVMYLFAKDPRVPASYGGLIQEQRRLARNQEDESRAWRNRV